MKKIAINGFGRIGTAIFELIIKEKDLLKLVAINWRGKYSKFYIYCFV